ncbi:MAG: hypothetical protein ACRC41_04645 [Sarcina sp.]
MSKTKYNFYEYEKSYKRQQKQQKKYTNSRNKSSEFDEIKSDFQKLCFDVKKIFNKKIKHKHHKNLCDKKHEEVVKKACIGILGFVILSAVISFPVAMIVCLTIAGLYYCK